jgi:hypothetical protein
MRRRAFQALYPEINNGLGLIVSILEFRDIARLIKTVKKLGRLFDSYDPIRRSPGRVVDVLNDGVLSTSFGLFPIISDIKGIAADLIDLRKTIAEFVERGKKAHSYHYKEVISDEKEYVQDTIAGEIFKQTKVTYFATLKCRYQYDARFDESLMRVGGLRVSPSLVWDAIPWTFVVDWVINIGRWLDQFDRDPHVKVEILDYCDTLKHQLIVYEDRVDDHLPIAYAGQSPCSSLMQGEGKLWQWESSLYERTPGVPDPGVSFPVWDLPSYRELMLSGSLIWATGRR